MDFIFLDDLNKLMAKNKVIMDWHFSNMVSAIRLPRVFSIKKIAKTNNIFLIFLSVKIGFTRLFFINMIRSKNDSISNGILSKIYRVLIDLILPPQTSLIGTI